MIIAVIDMPLDDEADLFIVDLDKLDQTDPEQKEYRDAVITCLGSESPLKLGVSSHLMINHTSRWRHALVSDYPVAIDGIAKIVEL